MLSIAEKIPAAILRLIVSFKRTTPINTAIKRLIFAIGTTLERGPLSSARKNRIVATAAMIPPNMLYFKLPISILRSLFVIKYAPRMICARNWNVIKTIEEATGLLLPEDNLIKNCITP